MACAAVRKAVLRSLDHTYATSEAVWRRVGWWHPETVKEALSELRFEGIVGYHARGGRTYYTNILKRKNVDDGPFLDRSDPEYCD